MSISLKYVGDKISNHETRIKALEDKQATGSGSRFKVIQSSKVNKGFGGSWTNIVDLTNANSVELVSVTYQVNGFSNINTNLFHIEELRSTNDNDLYSMCGQVWNSGGWYSSAFIVRLSGTMLQAKVTRSNRFDGIAINSVQTYGLKVYYTFSIILMLILSNFLNILYERRLFRNEY